MSKLSKLRRLSFDELRVRATQSLNASLERRGWSSLAKLPNDDELFALLDIEIGSDEQLFAHFRTRTAPRFFEGLANKQQTVDAIRTHFPECERQTLEKTEHMINGKFDLLGLCGLSFGDPIDWQLEPVSRKRSSLDHWSRLNYLDAGLIGDKKIVWELNRHQYFVTLGQAYWLTDDERFAATFAAHLDSWMEQNPPKLGINWASSLEVSFRSISWLWAFYFFKDSPSVSAALFTRALKFLYLHARHLETYLSTYFSPNTHLTGEALGLFYLGTLLPEFRAAKRWQDLGCRILIEQLSTHVQPDGVYFEQSSYYHRYTTDFYTHFLILSRLNQGTVPDEVESKLKLLLDHLMYITRPDGTTPLFGDDDGGRLMMLDQRAAANDFRSSLATAAVLFNRADYKFVATEPWHGRPARGESHIGKMPMPPSVEATAWLLGPESLVKFEEIIATEPETQSKAFTTGGYYAMRDGWGETANYLLIDCGPHGMNNCGHAHADALSFELAVNGKTLLVDPGTYTYTGSKELRDWFRGSAAHNTLMVDGQDSSVPAGPFSWSSIARCYPQAWITRERFDYFQGRHDGYEHLAEPVQHSRAVLFLKDDYWIIHDRVRSEGRHSYGVRFHPDSGLNLDNAGEGTRTISDSNQDGLKLACFAENGTWQREDGFVSHCYAERVSAPSLVFASEAVANTDFLTFLLPQGKAESVAMVRAVEAIGGLAFEITGRSSLDIVLVKNEKRAEMSRLASDFEWTWARYADEGATIPEQLVLIGGQWLELGGKEVLRSGRRINYLIASRIGDQFRIETDDGVLQLRLPIGDFESAISSLRSTI
jgi:hypothetical protein